jgi:hypothetical protein
MKISDWEVLVGRASTGAEVVQLSVQFLAQWPADRLAALPAECRPPLAMHTVAHVSDYALKLVQARLAYHSPSQELDAMATFFAAATTRLAQLLSTKPRNLIVPFFNKDTDTV